MKAFEFVLSKIQESGLVLPGKNKELIVRQFKRDRVEMGFRRAEEALTQKLETEKAKCAQST